MNEYIYMDPSARAAHIHNQGMQAWRDGRLDEALEYFLRAHELKEEIGNLSAAASTIHMIGVVYSQKKNWKNAVRYFLRSLDIDANDGHFEGVARSLNDISVMCGKRSDREGESALFELANLVLNHYRGQIQLTQDVVDRCCANASPDLKIDIQQAMHCLMNWKYLRCTT